MTCQIETRLLDQSPSAETSPDFAIHLADCTDCRDAIVRWRIVQQEIIAIDENFAPVRQVPVSVAARDLVNRATTGENPRHTPAFSLNLVAAAASFVFVASFAAYMVFSNTTSTPSVEVSGTATVLADGEMSFFDISQPGQRITVQESGRGLLQLNDDEIGLGANSSLLVEETSEGNTRISLEEGQVAFKVSHRKKGDHFEVKSGPFRIRVIGTRFSVSYVKNAGVTVAVADGEVEVSRGSTSWSVKKNHQLRLKTNGQPVTETLTEKNSEELARLLNPELRDDDTTQPSYDTALVDAALSLDTAIDVLPNDPPRKTSVRIRPIRQETGPTTWRTWILEGRRDEARTELKIHLKRHPKDVSAWSLLADCERKSQRWEQSIIAYQKIVKMGSSMAKRRALFRMGAIHQDRLDNPAMASKQFKRYISSSTAKTSMRAEAMLRLARAQKAMGKNSEAKSLLQKVTQEHQGTTAASTARNMLKSL